MKQYAANALGMPRAVSFFVVAAGIVITIYGMRELSWLLGPFLLAAFIVVVVYPLYRSLEAKGVPKGVAIGALFLTIFGVLIGISAVVVFAMSRLASMIPEYASRMRTILAQLSQLMSEYGIKAPQIGELLEGIDLPSAALWLTSRIPSIAGLATTLVLLGTALIFLAIESTQMSFRSADLRRHHPQLAAAMTQSLTNTRRFIGVTTVCALGVGILDTIFLIFMGIPLAWLWGLLAAVCNYIPYVGFLVGMAPPALLALLLDGWQAMVVVFAVYITLNFIVTSAIPAKVIGDAVGLSMVVEVTSIAFWAWVLGPVGAILAVPLTIFAKAALIDSDPRAGWLSGFISSGKDVRSRSANYARHG